MSGRVVVVMLTAEQIEALHPVLEEARRAGEAGTPGMVVAQVFVEEMRVGFMPQERALPIAQTVSTGPRLIRSAHD